MKLNYIVKDNKYENIHQVLREELGISTRLLTKLIKNNKVLLNNIPTDTRNSIKINDVVDVLLNLEEDNTNIEPAKIDLDIVYEDEGLLIINKPAGIAVHPSIRHFSDNLSSGVKFYFDKIGLKKKIRPVTRLDLGTSGLVVFAKNEYIQECLINQMKNRTFKKEYMCIASGTFKEKEGVIDLPIARKADSIIERCVNENGQKSVTRYKVIKEYGSYSLVECSLETGRTHQIRVHMAYTGHSLLGDTLYGSKSEYISRQALHCYRLTFLNPTTNENIKLECSLPDDLLLICKNTLYQL